MNMTTTIELVPVTCCVCGVVFAIEETLNQRFLDSGESFSCPNEHGQSYSASTTKKLRAEIERLKSNRDYYSDMYYEERNSHISTKGQLTKTKNKLDKLSGKKK